MKKNKLKTAASSAGKKALELAQGDVVDARFFKKHFFATAFIVITCMALIAARFEHATTAATVRALQKEIDRADTYKQEEQARYMTLTRESAMIHLVDSLGLGLEISSEIPQTLDYNVAPSQR